MRPAKVNNSLPHVAIHFHTLQHTVKHSTLQHRRSDVQCAPGKRQLRFATECSRLQHTAAHCSTPLQCRSDTRVQLVTFNDSVQHTATHRSTLQHYRRMPHAALTHPNALQHFASVCKRLQHRRSDTQCEAGNSP